MLLDDLANTLPTIKSRAIVHYLELYSTDDLTSYCDDFCDFTPNEKEKVLLLCKSPGEINVFKEVNIIDFGESLCYYGNKLSRYFIASFKVLTATILQIP